MNKKMTFISIILLTVLTSFSQTTYTNLNGVSMGVGEGTYLFTENLTLDANSSVDLSGLATVTNSLTNQGEITINNDAGSLVNKGTYNSSTNSTYNVIRTLKNAGLAHYVSPTVENTPSTVFDGGFVYQYEEQNSIWVPTTGNLSKMQGYLAIMPQELIITFTGHNIYSGLNTLTLFNQVSGWNLIGNPYPCAVNWDETSGWTKTNIENTIYFWDGSNYQIYGSNKYGKFYTKNASNIIYSQQGFFVKALTGAASITVNDNAKQHNVNDLYKSTVDAPVIKIAASSNSFSDEAVIYFTDETTENYEPNFDAEKLFSSTPGVPQVFTKSANNTNLTLNALPLIFDQMTIPLFFTSSQNSVVELSFPQIQNISQNVYLKDLQTNKITSIDESTVYNFLYNTNDNANRFELLFSETALNVNNVTKQSNIFIYTDNKILNIVTDQNFDIQNSVVNVYTVSGSKIISKNITSTISKIDMSNFSNGVYIVSVNNYNKNYTQKIIIK